MDNINLDTMEEEDCTEYIYNEDYINYLIKYDNDLRSVREIINPSCIDVINSRFLVAYKQAPRADDLEAFFAYGYNNLPKVYGLMDVPAVEDIGAFAVRSLPGLALDGRNVLVGFVDTGIDFTNPVFTDSLGSTRIEYIWDQNQESYGVGAPVFGYGGEYSKEDINRARVADNPYELIPARDEEGHGTFMASIAAGNENLEENFSGVAPGASIIMVKLKPAPRSLRDFYYVGQDKNCYSETDIVQGIRYLINKALQLSMPMVICLGVGTNQGGHDGNSNLELYMETLSGLRGVCFVAPGGNELGARNHFQGNDQVMEINVESGVLGFAMEIWGNAPGLLGVVIESPSGERLSNIVPNDTGPTRGDFIFEGSSLFVENIVVESETGDQVYFLRFSSPAQGIWRIIVSESLNQLGGGYNAWLPIREFSQEKVTFIRSSPDTTITSPGNSTGCITAATYNNSNGAIYVLSSRGFTRKGGIKPDVTAPGVDITGVFASGGERTLYTEKSGSSVATAFVAGAAVLMLQWGIVNRNNLGINTEIIKQQLARGASRESGLSYPNNVWGWGTLDILQTFQNMRQ